MTDQRKNQRFDMRLPIEILGAKPQPGETRNMSSCGVLFTALAPVNVGEPIEYLVTLPKAAGSRASVRLKCLGTVVRSGEAESHFAATLERYEFVRAKA
jgi:hypothetical protein